MTRRRFLIASASAAGALASGSVASVYRFEIESAHAEVERLATPLRVAFLCDLHFGPYLRAGSVRAWVSAALAAAPDLIVLGGDLVDGRRVGHVPDLVDELARLQAPLGVYAVWGNHDHHRFRGELAGFAARLERHGVRVLLNAGTTVREDLYLAGVDDLRTGRPDLGAALAGRPERTACLLVSHNPDLLPEVPAEVALTLCGHTHGGQVRIPGVGPLVTSSVYGDRFVQGWVRAPARGYVSRGLGVSLVPLRVACPPELTVLDLVPAN